jgi:ABC-type glycerol-3-phosphate transport system permease component
MLMPFYWMTITSLRTESEIFSKGVNLVPDFSKLISYNYRDLLKDTLFARWLLNSVILALGTTVIAVLISSLAGFAFAKYRFFGKSVLYTLVLGLAVIPQFVTIIPVFTLMNKLQLTNRYASLILPFSANAFAVFLMNQYLLGFPNDLLDSARMDGFSEIRIFFWLVLPIARPALGAAAIFVFQNMWNQYMWPLVMMQTDRMFTFPIGLAAMAGLFAAVRHGVLMAAAFLSTVPLIIIFVVMQRQFISGLTAGALKG